MRKDLSWIQNNFIAHRGLHTKNLKIPENTMLAFEKAINLGFSIEFDLNMLKDGEIIVFHDFNFKRLTGLVKNANELTYDDIKNLRICDTDEHIPTFNEVLDFVKGRVPLLIELKPFGNTNQFCTKVYEILKSYHGQYAIFSFNPSVVRWFKKNQPHVIRGQIAESFKHKKDINPFLGHLLGTLFFNRFTKPDFISYKLKELPNKYLDKSMKKGITIISYASQNQEEFDFVKLFYHNSVFEYFIPNTNC